ncbi:unnamed protein product [Mucor fragilis]
MGFTYRAYLDEEAKRCKIYACSRCSSHLSTFDYLISKDFHGVHGKAYLFENVVNIVVSHESEVREMTTGKHLIRYISCSGCDEELGWKYIKAYGRDQKYKEGKFILEKCGLEQIVSVARDRIIK